MDSLTIVLSAVGFIILVYLIARTFFRIGYIYAIKETLSTLKSVRDKSGNDYDYRTAAANAENMRVDIKDGIIYLYTEVGDEFIAQGKTFEELAEVIQTRFPKRVLAIKKQDLEKVLNHGKSV
jgi:hypothetical protein